MIIAVNAIHLRFYQPVLVPEWAVWHLFYHCISTNHEKMMYRKGIQTVALFSFIILLTGCTKSTKDEQSGQVTGKVSPKGTSTGAPVSKQIGVGGGVLQLPDQSVSITIPAGALTGTTTVSIEPITNTNVGGLGKAYRLLPHGVQFAKPVALTLSYAAIKDSLAMPQALALSYQGEDGIWYCMGGNVVDTVTKTVTVQTTHFSDWSGMNWIMITPRRAILSEDAEIELVAKVFIPVHGDILQEPVYDEDGYPVGDPQPLPDRFIKGWTHTGPGTLISIEHEALYVAPHGIAVNYTVPVTCELKSATHKYLLVANIDLRSKDLFEISINGGEWQRLGCKLVVSDGRVHISNSLSEEEENVVVMGWPADGKMKYVWHDNDPQKDALFTYWPNGGGAAKPAYNNTYDTDIETNIPSGGGVTLTEFGAKGEYVIGTFVLNPVGLRRGGTYLGSHKIEGRFKLKRF
jgi:hypothetical protein